MNGHADAALTQAADPAQRLAPHREDVRHTRRQGIAGLFTRGAVLDEEKG
jgi:hypothetical protein